MRSSVGESVNVQAIVFADGHDSIACELLYRSADSVEWRCKPMAAKGNDCGEAEFPVASLGRHLYTVQGWVDRFNTWHAGLRKRIAAGRELSVELPIGAELVEQAANHARGEDAARLRRWAESLRAGNSAVAESEDLLAAMGRRPDLSLAAEFGRELSVIIDREKARFSTWYAIFPHSTAMKPGRHGTFAGREKRLPYIASMGFDVVYLPPISSQFRKGKNNSPAAEPRDAGTLTPVPRHNYRVGAPQDGYRKEVLNSGAPPYGGSGQGNKGGVEASPPPMHGRQRLLSVTPPPPGAVVIKPERA